MASTNSHRASLPSTRRCTYDVFLSFCGQDTRSSFADHLCSAMKEQGIKVFIDNEKLVKGEDIPSGLLSAIEESEFAVVIISENYVLSTWCLLELGKIVGLQRENRLKVLPVFYHVDRFDEQKNNFEQAFAEHRANPAIDEEERTKWRAALKTVSLITGWDVRGRRESEVIEDICGEIVGRFSQNSPNRMERRPGISEEMPRVVPGLERPQVVPGLERPQSISEEMPRVVPGLERPQSISEEMPRVVPGLERPQSISEEMPRVVPGLERPQSISEEMPRVVPGLERPQSISEEMRRMQSYVEMLRRPVDDARRLLYFTFTSLVFFFLKRFSK